MVGYWIYMHGYSFLQHDAKTKSWCEKKKSRFGGKKGAKSKKNQSSDHQEENLVERVTQAVLEALKDRAVPAILDRSESPQSLDGESDSEITFKEIERSNDEYATSEPIDILTWSIPISAMVSQKLKQKIWQDQFIDLAVLLPNNLVPGPDSSNYTFKLEKNDNISVSSCCRPRDPNKKASSPFAPFVEGLDKDQLLQTNYQEVFAGLTIEREVASLSAANFSTSVQNVRKTTLKQNAETKQSLRTKVSTPLWEQQNNNEIVTPGCLMTKTDIESAFCILPVCREDHELLFQWDGCFYFDKCLPMGCASSCSIFENFSSGLEWIGRVKGQIPHIVHVLDDFLFIGPPGSDICNQSLVVFRLICESLGVYLKEEKTFQANTKLVFLCIEIDTVAMEIRLPEEKLFKRFLKVSLDSEDEPTAIPSHLLQLSKTQLLP
uniref:Reverse transcriptase domain-containing protein n=1 Tax=Magallana gigas TaxID=29159 RepID=A0A8W8M2W2_MAGGI